MTVQMWMAKCWEQGNIATWKPLPTGRVTSQARECVGLRSFSICAQTPDPTAVQLVALDELINLHVVKCRILNLVSNVHYEERNSVCETAGAYEWARTDSL